MKEWQGSLGISRGGQGLSVGTVQNKGGPPEPDGSAAQEASASAGTAGASCAVCMAAVPLCSCLHDRLYCAAVSREPQTAAAALHAALQVMRAGSAGCRPGLG